MVVTYANVNPAGKHPFLLQILKVTFLFGILQPFKTTLTGYDITRSFGMIKDTGRIFRAWRSRRVQVGQKQKAGEFCITYAKGLGIAKGQVGRPSIPALGVAVTQTLKKDLSELGVLWGRGPGPHCHSVLWSYLNQ